MKLFSALTTLIAVLAALIALIALGARHDWESFAWFGLVAVVSAILSLKGVV